MVINLTRTLTLFKKGKKIRINVDSIDFTSQLCKECEKNKIELTENEFNTTIKEIFEGCALFGLVTRV